MHGRVIRGAHNTRADARLCTGSGLASLFSGEVGDCKKHWQRKSERQGTRAAEPWKQPFERPTTTGKGKDGPF